MTDAELTAYEVALQLRGYEVRYTRGALHYAELYLGGAWRAGRSTGRCSMSGADTS